jgi:hypothetical protein
MPSSEPLLTLGRAVELHEKGELQVRKRFRNQQPVEWQRRWDSACETRMRLQFSGNWEAIVTESEKAREYECAVVRGEVEDPEAAAGGSRIVMSVGGAASKKATAQLKNHFDGGLRLSFAELLETAGETPEERLFSAMLLAEFKNEAEAITFEKRLQDAAESYQKAKAQMGPEAAATMAKAKASAKAGNSRALFAIGAAVLIGIALAVGGFGSDDSLQQTLDLMQ